MECGEKVDLDTELDRLYRTIVSDGLDQPGTGRSTRMSQTAMIGPITQVDRYTFLSSSYLIVFIFRLLYKIPICKNYKLKYR